MQESAQAVDATELLLLVTNLKPTGIVDVCLTVDGFYIGMMPGDIGYNAFIGKPSHHEGPGMDHSRKVWNGLSEDEQRALLHRCRDPLDGAPIPLHRFLGVESLTVGVEL